MRCPRCVERSSIASQKNRPGTSEPGFTPSPTTGTWVQLVPSQARGCVELPGTYSVVNLRPSGIPSRIP